MKTFIWLTCVIVGSACLAFDFLGAFGVALVIIGYEISREKK